MMSENDERPICLTMDQFKQLSFKSGDFVLVNSRIGVVIQNSRTLPHYCWKPQLEDLVESPLKQEIIPVEFYGQSPPKGALSTYHAGKESKQYKAFYLAECLRMLSKKEAETFLEKEPIEIRFELERLAGLHVLDPAIYMLCLRLKPTGYLQLQK